MSTPTLNYHQQHGGFNPEILLKCANISNRTLRDSLPLRLSHRPTNTFRSSSNKYVSGTSQSGPDLTQVLTQEKGGTTYFFKKKQTQQAEPTVKISSINTLPDPSPKMERMTFKPKVPSCSMSHEARQDIFRNRTRTTFTVDSKQDPKRVGGYYSAFPLEPTINLTLQKSSTFRYATTCYKAINHNDGLSYCLRRIHGLRGVNEKCMTLVEMWKKLEHPNIVQLREFFPSIAFEEPSFVFAYDYFPGAETMMEKHFQNQNNNLTSKWNERIMMRDAGLIPESLIWTYVIQLSSALQCIHAAGLACRVMDPTKILITDQSRLRINGVGVFDVLEYDSANVKPPACRQQHQQEDMIAFGKVVLALACNSVTPFQQDDMHKSIDIACMNYSSDLKDLIKYLTTPQQKPLNLNDIIPMIGTRFYTHLNVAMMRDVATENELSEKEEQNGCLFRILSKLEVVKEQARFDEESSMSETGDRFLLKLFFDHLFHQVTDTGAPQVDMFHITQCLKKLDAGVPEMLSLVSRDEQNVIVLSYAELKKAFTNCYDELLTAE